MSANGFVEGGLPAAALLVEDVTPPPQLTIESIDEALLVEGLAEEDPEGALDWISSIGSGLASGASIGAAGGPIGAIIGGVLGAGLGAVSAAQQQQQQQQQQPSRPPQPPPRPAPPPQAPAPHPAARPAVPPQRPAGGGAQLGQTLTQIAQLLPQITAILAQLAATGATQPAPAPEASDEELTGDYVSADAQVRESEVESIDDEALDDEAFGITGGLPVESELELESGPAPEYPLAARFEPAAEGNFRRWTAAEPRQVRRIVIHITDGGRLIEGTISHFRNPASRVSAHYVVGQDGQVVQMVRHNDVAYHASSANGDSIGIEHVARAPRTFRPDDPGLQPTVAEYASSAALVRWLVDRYGVPLDRAHVLGHAEADPQTTHRGCPDAAWSWATYWDLLAPPTRGEAEGEEPEGAGASEAEGVAETESDEESAPLEVETAGLGEAASPWREVEVETEWADEAFLEALAPDWRT